MPLLFNTFLQAKLPTMVLGTLLGGSVALDNVFFPACYSLRGKKFFIVLAQPTNLLRHRCESLVLERMRKKKSENRKNCQGRHLQFYQVLPLDLNISVTYYEIRCLQVRIKPLFVEWLLDNMFVQNRNISGWKNQYSEGTEWLKLWLSVWRLLWRA